ncbi:MAG: hypothetical protein L0Y71_16310 [Gemmataceae bacterium]|nr:hypothetical protein [Gemmataceae bacterium]
MARRSWWLAGILLGAFLNTGCCRWCERWCGAPHAAPVAYAPQAYAAPAYAAPAYAPQHCVPCCPVVCTPASSPAGGQWQRGPYGCP